MPMKRIVLVCLAMLLAIDVSCWGQDWLVVDIGQYVEELNDRCPISYGDVWSAHSFTLVGDRYALVDLQVPESLMMFLPQLTEDTDNVKRLWVKQFRDFDDHWRRLLDMLADANYPLVVIFSPANSDDYSILTIQPSLLANR